MDERIPEDLAREPQQAPGALGAGKLRLGKVPRLPALSVSIGNLR